MNLKLLLRQRFFERNIVIYYDEIFYFIKYLTGDATVAEDLLQNVMEKAWRHCHKIKSKKSIKCWLFKIAKNETSSYYKSAYRCSFLEEQIQIKFKDFENLKQDDVLSALINIEDTLLLKKALLLLDRKYLSVILLRYLNELSFEEISLVLDINCNTARTNLKRGLNKLKKIYLDLEQN
ncbi:MAG: RNA polymerase sigma factor [Aminipila sp.]